MAAKLPKPAARRTVRKTEYTATAFESRPTTKKHSDDWHGHQNEVVVYTDEGKEIPIVVPRYRLRGLIEACIDALEGEDNTY